MGVVNSVEIFSKICGNSVSNRDEKSDGYDEKQDRRCEHGEMQN